MEVRMPSQEIAERMYGDYRPRNSALFQYGFLEEFFQGLPGATGKFRKLLSVVEKITAQDFGYTEDKMTMWNLLEDFFTKPFTKFHDTLLMTGWTEMSSFARKGKSTELHLL